jgi:hypothetical protein
MPRIYAEAYLELMKEHEPLTLAKLKRSNRLEARLRQIEDEFKQKEIAARHSIQRTDPLPDSLLVRVARVGNDESVAREIAMEELASLFTKQLRRLRPTTT